MQSTSTEFFTYWFIFQNDQLLFIKHDDQYQLPTSPLAIHITLHRHHHLGIFNSITCYCAEIATPLVLSETLAWIPLRKAFDMLGDDWYSMAVKAFSIINWDKNHQYCGRCGQLTEHKSGAFERICSSCRLSVFPRISPSVIVLIKKNDQLLMARSPHFRPGAYGLIAGFLEVGESLEEAVHREVMEEVGLTIQHLQYFGSQPWPFPDSIMIGFTADYASGEISIDHHEIEAAGWYRYDQLPGWPSSRISISRKLIDHFITEQQSIHGK